MYYLGIDGGGTKTAFTIIDENKNIVYQDILGPSSLDTVGFDNTIKVLKEGIKKITYKLESCFIGLGGISDGVDEPLVKEAILSSLPGVKIEVGSDTVNALFGSLGGADGIAIIAGTGSVAFGKNGKLNYKAGGYGYQEGDSGSAYDLGFNAIRYLARVYDGRKEGSEFSDDLSKATNTKTRSDLVTYVKDSNRTIIAKLAMVVTKNQDNEVARKIIVNSVNEMLAQIKACYVNLKFTDGCLFGINGSLGEADTLYRRLLLEGLKEINPNIKCIDSIYDTKLGAAIKALDI